MIKNIFKNKPLPANKIAKDDFILIAITRHVVESMCLDTFEAQRDELRKAGLDAKEKLNYFFDGYDDDACELFEISEVRQFTRRMFEIAPEILFYLSPVSRELFLDCLLDNEKVAINNACYGIVRKDNKRNRRLIKALDRNRDNYIQKVTASNS